MVNKYNKYGGKRSRLDSGRIKKATTLQGMKQYNKSVGGHFFDRRNPPVISKRGDYLVTGAMRGRSGFVVYKYDPNTGRVNHMDNPYGEYSWQPHKTKSDAIECASYLNNLSRNQ